LKRAVLINFLLTSFFALLGFAVMGYHPGVEDDGVYLSAIKSDLNPALYPFDKPFFRTQLQATIFDKVIAGIVHHCPVPLGVAVLLVQLLSIFLVVFAARRILSHFFDSPWACWAGVAMFSAMFILPVAGTALYIMDENLHPRNIATALILIGIEQILSRRYQYAVPVLLLAFFFHPIMGAMGLSFAVFLVIAQLQSVHDWLRQSHLIRVRAYGTAVIFFPLAWIFEPPTPIWREALNTRTYMFIGRWEWYEWLGAVAPIILFWLLSMLARSKGMLALERFAFATALFGSFQLIVAMILLGIPALVRFTPMQPMRFLQLIYCFMTMIGGSLLGSYLLKKRTWAWAIYLVVIFGSMFAVQRQAYASSEQFELPGRESANPWVEAFAWVRQNTPTDAYFALDPRYLDAPHEDFHSFRALAERSHLADRVKDTAVVTQVPELGPAWKTQVTATDGWKNFTVGDFERLKQQFGVTWVLVNQQQSAGLDCRWHNSLLWACQIP